uniref:TPT domain-containing protein n=1 Tax=Ascaris lumbricoides TaxID=6252 RepID=A0A0M3IS39_ASCLU
MMKPGFSGNKPKVQEEDAQDNGEPTEKTVDDRNEMKKNHKAEMSVVCLCTSMLLTGFNFYRFTSSAWAPIFFLQSVLP